MSDWQPIETVPREHGRWVWVRCDPPMPDRFNLTAFMWDTEHRSGGMWFAGTGWWYDVVPGRFTHWAPIPVPPTPEPKPAKRYAPEMSCCKSAEEHARHTAEKGIGHPFVACDVRDEGGCWLRDGCHYTGGGPFCGHPASEHQARVEEPTRELLLGHEHDPMRATPDWCWTCGVHRTAHHPEGSK